MAIKNFIPTVWSENLYSELDRQYIAVKHCNRDFEGDIRGNGSTVKICGVGAINVGDYTKDTDMSAPQTLSDTVRELKIDRAKYFNFQIDDIDRAQCSPKLMDAAMKVAADSLANEADRYIFSLHEKVPTQYTCTLSASSVLEDVLRARQTLAENGVTDFSDVVFEVSPYVATVLLQAQINLDTDNSAALQSGYLGSLAGCQIFVSNNVAVERDGMSVKSKCFLRTKRAIAFAEQLSEIEAYRPEKRFADAVKGLHLYGAEIVYPSEIVVLNCDVMVPMN